MNPQNKHDITNAKLPAHATVGGVWKIEARNRKRDVDIKYRANRRRNCRNSLVMI